LLGAASGKRAAQAELRVWRADKGEDPRGFGCPNRMKTCMDREKDELRA